MHRLLASSADCWAILLQKQIGNKYVFLSSILIREDKLGLASGNFSFFSFLAISDQILSVNWLSSTEISDTIQRLPYIDNAKEPGSVAWLFEVFAFDE